MEEVKPLYPTTTTNNNNNSNFVEAGYNDIQIILPIPSAQVLMVKNDAHYLIYIYMYILQHEPRTRMLKHTLLDSSRRRSHIATEYSWETGKPYWNIESLYNMVSIFKALPDK